MEWTNIEQIIYSSGQDEGKNWTLNMFASDMLWTEYFSFFK